MSLRIRVQTGILGTAMGDSTNRRRAHRAFLTVLSLVLVGGIGLVPANVSAARQKTRVKEPAEELVIRHSRWAVGPGVTGGLLTGEAADRLDGSKNTSVYGCGLTAEYSPSPLWRVGLSMELVYGQSHRVKYEGKNVRARSVSYSGDWLFFLAPGRRSSLFVHSAIGSAAMKLTNPDSEDGPSVTFFRAGLGHSRYSSSGLSTRFELYYKVLYTDGEEVTFGSRRFDVKFNTSYVGLGFSLLFSL